MVPGGASGRERERKREKESERDRGARRDNTLRKGLSEQKERKRRQDGLNSSFCLAIKANVLRKLYLVSNP